MKYTNTTKLTNIELALYNDLLNSYHAIKRDCNYNANRLLQMVSNSSSIISTVKDLVYRVDSYGYLKLLEFGRLDLSVEYLVVTKYSQLFSEDDIYYCKQKLGLI